MENSIATLKDALLEVRKAHRLVESFQERMLSLVNFITTRLDFHQMEGVKHFSNPIYPYRDGMHLKVSPRHWAWDFVYPYLFEYYVGEMELDETLTSREVINTKMRANLDQATDPWGIKVGRVELKNIIPPDQIVDAMEKQMKAERERREAILIAEGEKKSSILRAEGKKESAILEAEAEKEAAILRAEAAREKMIREAEGRAEAIRKTQQANADGIRMIKEAGADQAVLALKSLEVWPSVANGKATKIIIPSELQNVAGLIKSVAEVAKDSDIAQADPVLAGNGQQEEEDEVF